jgi:hypothetical protein
MEDIKKVNYVQINNHKKRFKVNQKYQTIKINMIFSEIIKINKLSDYLVILFYYVESMKV